MNRYWTRTAILLWAVLLGVACIRPLFKPTSSTVYPIYAFAGADFAAGEPLYSQNHPGADIYRYSPVVAAFFEPFSLLPWGVGGAVWRILGAALFLTGLEAWRKRVCPGASAPLFFLLALPLSVGSLSNGQANVHVLGLMLWGTLLAVRGWWSWAAAFIAAAALFKGYPIALGLLIALAAPIRFGLPLAGSLAFGCGIPFLLQDADYVSSQYRQWVVSVSNDDRSGFPLHIAMQDPQLLLRIAGVPMSLDAYRLVQFGAGAAVAVLVLLQLRKRRPREEVILNAFVLGLCWMATFGPCVEASTFILLAPVMAREALDAANRPRWAVPFAWAGSVLFFASVVLFAFPHHIHRPVISIGILPVAAILLCTAAVARSAGARTAPTEPAVAKPSFLQAA